MSEDFYIWPCILYLTWNLKDNKQARLAENNVKRIVKLAFVPVW
jgi:hypothetical protein